MTRLEDLSAACPDLDPAIVREFHSRMDPEYLSHFEPDDVARHLRLSTQLDDAHPARVAFTPRGDRCFDVVVVAFDYFSELSMLCGLLASFGLDIESGSIYTFAAAELPRGPRHRPPQVSPKKIVDVFRVRLLPEEEGFGDADRARLEEELLGLLHLVAGGRTDEARDRLNRHLVEHLERVRPRFGGVLLPVKVVFDNATDPRWTLVDIEAQDTPAFLWAVTNALCARGIYVHKVRIESAGSLVRDRFFVADRRGAKIEAASEQDALRMGIVLTKQFTYVLPRAPDPAKAARHFDQLLDKLMEPGVGGPPSLLREEQGLVALARLLGSSDFLWDDFLRMQFESLVPVLDELRTRDLPAREALEQELRQAALAAGTHATARAAMNRVKDREVFFIDMKHLLDPAVGIEAFSAAITGLAEAVLRTSLWACERELAARHGRLHGDGGATAFAIFGLGKFGGQEMGYASDIELLFVRDGSGVTEADGLAAAEYAGALAEEIIAFIEARADGIFQTDLRLRPFGRNGPMVSSLAQVRDYYREGGGADPFERQALVKLRFVAGDADLGRAVEAHRDAFTYSGAVWDTALAVHVRDRQSRELVHHGQVNLKYSPGGLLDAEYAVQYMQIQHGAARVELRTPTTLIALDRLRDAGVVTSDEHARLRGGYLFLRRVIEALRMVKGTAGDLILPPAGSDELKFLARRLAYSGADWSEAAGRFMGDLTAHMSAVAEVYDRRFGRVR